MESINSLNDLNQFSSAPSLTQDQALCLLIELESYMANAEWFTLGIMAESSQKALAALREIESKFYWNNMQVIDKPEEEGPVFLKANQNSGEVQNKCSRKLSVYDH